MMKKSFKILLSFGLIFFLSFSTAFAENRKIVDKEKVGDVLRQINLINGNGTSLGLDEPLKREDAIIILCRLKEKEEEAKNFRGKSAFTDIEDNFYKPYISYAEKKGWVTGKRKSVFGYSEQITVKEFAATLLRSLGCKNYKGENYENVPKKAEELGLLNDLNLGIDDKITRGDAFVMMKNSLNISLKNKEGKDEIKKALDSLKDAYIMKYDKVIALTFDDGPSLHTSRLLDILKANNVKASFFVVGSQVEKYPDLISRMGKEGHEVGSHSFSHSNLTKLSNQGVINEITETREKLKSLLGHDVNSVRPPYGAYDGRVMSIAKDLGIYFVYWDIDTVDWKTRNSEMVYNSIIDSVNNGNVILTHDIHKTTVDSMEKVIPKLLEEGYAFLTVSELLLLERKELRAGEVYFNMRR